MNVDQIKTINRSVTSHIIYTLVSAVTSTVGNYNTLPKDKINIAIKNAIREKIEVKQRSEQRITQE